MATTGLIKCRERKHIRIMEQENVLDFRNNKIKANVLIIYYCFKFK